MITIKLADEEGYYLIQDYFSSNIGIFIENINGDKELTSKFDILSSDDYLEIENINYEELVNSYKKLESNLRYDCALGTLLKLITAYDKSGNKTKDIYNSAAELSEWLYDESVINNNSIEIALLNRLQVIKRKRKLNKDEKKTLKKISSDNSQPIKNRIGANLLLDKVKEVDRLLEKLPTEEREEFKKYPIFKFYSN